MKSIKPIICFVALLVLPSVSWGTDYTGIWKGDCSDFFGVQIKPAENQLYSVSFCALHGCDKPGNWTPNTRIEGDPKYKVISPSELGIKREDEGYFFYKKCTSDPAWIVAEPKRTPPVPCYTIGKTHSTGLKDTTLIALLVVKEDLLKNKIHDEILLIGKYSHGKYDVVSRWDDNKKVEISERKDLLQAHNKYIVYQNGKSIKESVINKICKAGYECSAIDIGCGQTTSLTTTTKKVKGRLEKEYQGFNNGIDFKERTSAFVALNSDAPAAKKQKASIMIEETPQAVIVKISEYVKKVILKDQPNLNARDVKISQLLAFKLTRDDSVQYVVEAKAENEKIKVSGIYILQLIKTNIKELFSVKESNDPESWGNGYSFLDALDIDGDGIPELIFEVRGYESTGYRIYHLEKDGYKQVFDDVISGC